MTALSHNRAVARIRSLCFHVVSALVSLGFVLLYPFILAPRRVVWAILSSWVAAQVFLLRWVAGIGYRVRGWENLPEGPCILAARHESMWETMVLPMRLGNPTVFLKEEILRYPIAGPVARKLGYIGVNRDGDLAAAKRSFDLAKGEVAKGRRVLIFPSGTRNPAHRTRVQTGVAVLYRQLKLPCVPIVLNSGDHWLYRSWLRLPGMIEVEIRPPIPPDLKTREFLDRLSSDLTRPGDQASTSAAMPSVASPSSLGISDRSERE